MTSRFYFVKKFHFIILYTFLQSNCFGSFLLENDEIVNIHKNMAKTIKDAYTTLPYAASEKFNNLCSASIQFVYKENGNFYTRNQDFLYKEKPIVTSSSYTENLYDKDKDNPLKVLSWPFFKTGQLRCIEDKSNFQKEIPTKIYGHLYDTNKSNKTCAESLGLSLSKYNAILTNPEKNKNPIHYLKTQYKYDSLEEMKHAEPLLIWKLESNLSKIKEKCLKELTETWKIENKDIMSEEEDSPVIEKTIVHFYTKRQTCYRCEQLIQSSAQAFGYVPIISFSDLYFSDEGSNDDKICEVYSKTKYHLPFSKLKNDQTSTRFLTEPSKPTSVYNFLNEKYPVTIDMEFSDFKKNNKSMKNLFRYKKHYSALEGIERFPIQFYTPSK